MQRVAVAKAENALRRASAARDRLRDASNLTQARDAWEDFLAENTKFFEKLSKGSRINPKSEAWFGRVKHERKTDHLLRYLMHARNAEEHTLDEVTKSSVAIGASKGRVRVHSLAIRGDGEIIHSDVEPLTDGARLAVKLHLRMLPVTDRSDNVYQPPAEHLGKPVPNVSPLSIANFALEHMTSLIETAKGLVV